MAINSGMFYLKRHIIWLNITSNLWKIGKMSILGVLKPGEEHFKASTVDLKGITRCNFALPG